LIEIDKEMEPALDRGMFRSVIRCLGVRVAKQDVSKAQKVLKQHLLGIRKIHNVREDGEKHRLLLLMKKEEELDLQRLLNAIPYETKEQEVEVNYDHLTAQEILSKLLPPDVEVPTSFETIGHIAHLNLRPEHEPFKRRIGEVILDKAANVKTVVNKTGIIETQFRTFPMEVLAGLDDMNVELKLNSLRFRFNFGKVYWNSRLSEEHERLVKAWFKPGDLILDGFCGVGPFAIRAAKKGCAVQANDLNPESVLSLVGNAELNKIPVIDQRGGNPRFVNEKGKISVFNTDAREFLRFTLKHLPLKQSSHIVMNLPATAPEFLDCLIGSLSRTSPVELPMVHCYCFSSKHSLEERQSQVEERVRGMLKMNASQSLEVTVRDVRDVAPNKYMVCAHFQLPSQIAFDESKQEGSQHRDKMVKMEGED